MSSPAGTTGSRSHQLGCTRGSLATRSRVLSHCIYFPHLRVFPFEEPHSRNFRWRSMTACRPVRGEDGPPGSRGHNRGGRWCRSNAQANGRKNNATGKQGGHSGKELCRHGRQDLTAFSSQQCKKLLVHIPMGNTGQRFCSGSTFLFLQLTALKARCTVQLQNCD